MIKTIEIPTYRGTCPICKTVFEFSYGDMAGSNSTGRRVRCPKCLRELFLGEDCIQPIYKKANNDLERLYSQICRFMKALDPQVNPNNPEEIKIKERVFNGSEDYHADEQDLFRFIEIFMYEIKLKGEGLK